MSWRSAASVSSPSKISRPRTRERGREIAGDYERVLVRAERRRPALAEIPASPARSMAAVDQYPTPGDSPPEPPEVAAERARERLHTEIERVRSGVEEMLSEQGSGIDETALRRELDALREETDFLLKRRVRKTEKRLNKRIDKVNTRTDALEQRLDQVEQERKYAEWRIHTNTEQLLDGLLQEIRTIADLLTQR